MVPSAAQMRSVSVTEFNSELAGGSIMNSNLSKPKSVVVTRAQLILISTVKVDFAEAYLTYELCNGVISISYRPS